MVNIEVRIQSFKLGSKRICEQRRFN